jgi:hypothetical protein
MFIAAVCDVAFRLVCSPTGSSPKTASKQNAATPSAIATSIRENPFITQRRLIIA